MSVQHSVNMTSCKEVTSVTVFMGSPIRATKLINSKKQLGGTPTKSKSRALASNRQLCAYGSSKIVLIGCRGM